MCICIVIKYYLLFFFVVVNLFRINSIPKIKSIFNRALDFLVFVYILHGCHVTFVSSVERLALSQYYISI